MPDNSSDTRDDVSFSTEERRLMTRVEKVNIRSQVIVTYAFVATAAVLTCLFLMYAAVPLNKTKFLSAVCAGQMAIFITMARLNVLRCYSVIQKLQKQSRTER